MEVAPEIGCVKGLKESAHLMEQNIGNGVDVKTWGLWGGHA